MPFTLAMQYYTPGIMRGIQTVAEPILGGAFSWSANRYAQKWGNEHGFDADSTEVKERANELYQHEVTHLPHAIMWTGSAAGLNILTQKLVTRNPGRTRDLVLGKAFGSVGTLALVLGLRTLAPGKVQQLDEWNTKNLAEPLTRRVSGLFGIDSETVDRVFDHEREFADGHHIIERSKKHRKKHDESYHKGSDQETTSAKDAPESARDAHTQPDNKVQSASANVTVPLSFTRLIG